MAQDSTQMIARTGGETKVTSLFGNLMNQLTNSENTLSVQDLTTKILNTYGGEQRQVIQFENNFAFYYFFPAVFFYPPPLAPPRSGRLVYQARP